MIKKLEWKEFEDIQVVSSVFGNYYVREVSKGQWEAYFLATNEVGNYKCAQLKHLFPSEEAAKEYCQKRHAEDVAYVIRDFTTVPDIATSVWWATYPPPESENPRDAYYIGYNHGTHDGTLALAKQLLGKKA